MGAIPYHDVVIAGGGTASLALGLALRQAGGERVRVAILDPAFARPPRDDRRAFAIAAGTRAMLEKLGVWAAMQDGAQPINGMDITDSATAAMVRPLFLRFDGSVADGEPFAHMVENGPLAAALKRAAADAGVMLEPASVSGFTTEADRVVVTLTDGSQRAASLLVAADGAKSRLREQAGIPFLGWDYGQAGIVGTIAHEHDHEGRATEHFLPAGPFAQLPLRGRRSSIVWTERLSDVPRILARDPYTQAEMIEKRFGLGLGELKLETPLAAWPLSLGLARRFVGERFALLGDAAHVIHPIAGQGLNLGFKDAAALAEAVIDHMRLGLDAGAAEPLKRYQQARRFDTAEMAATTDVLNRLFSNDNPPLRSLRDFGLSVVDKAPPLKGLFMARAAGTGRGVPRLMRGEAL